MNLVGLNYKGEQVTGFMLYSNSRESRCRKTEEGRLNTGAPEHSSYGEGQIFDLKGERVWEDVTVLGSIVSAVISRWTDSVLKMSYSEASWTGMFNLKTFEWDVGGCKLPGVEDFNDNEFRIRDNVKFNFAGRWPEIQNAKIYRGVGDGGCANVGSLCLDAKRVAVTIGTSAAVRVVSEDVGYFSKGLWCYRIDARRKLVGGALTDGGSAVEWWENMYGEKLSEEVVGEAMGKDDCGVIAVPFLEGERSVGWRDNANCTIYGMNRSTTKVDVLRAIFDSISFGICRILDEMVECDIVKRDDAVLVCSGGALEKNGLWRRLICDVSGFNLCDFGEGSATSRGVAILIKEDYEGRKYVPSPEQLEKDTVLTPNWTRHQL
eukprot:CAMPEP_0182514184 /NCGR_PEP_ID=MMETSP1321-20130603/35298_1 /TAXON_ID=91990 /ORGANISM="Bolidomonas sp., Strain RCC1657" /LENGTH=376 /DNA_ID=CAMNT_0024721323 /DNA_START=121 /DNA_END=1247 /DNA_ORIENTATION=-